MAYTQDDRLIAIDTPLGKDVLLLAGFDGTEAISSLFRFELRLLSENHNIVFEDIIGRNVTISVDLADGEKRYFNGIISSFSQGSGGGDPERAPHFSFYSAAMVPWFWLLTQTADSRIFQNLSVPDIVEKIFTEKGFLDYRISLHESYEKRDYCVQYRETDFNYISRLLEDEGICYFFDHEDGKHTLVLADSPEDHKPCRTQESARYQISTGGWLDEDVITSLEKRQKITPGKYTLNDYNFKMPSTDLKVGVASQQALGPGEFEIYDYPGEYEKRAGGERLTNLRMQEEETQITTIGGSSVCRAFTSGYRFELQGHYRDDMDKKAFVLSHVDHMSSEETSYMTGSGRSEFSYSNSFTCIPFDVPYRPPRITPKPVVEGVQTAIVVGPEGEEIYTDEYGYGRVKVHFHWDREDRKGEERSCWIRVSQLWAGENWGAMYIPRIGHEVVVDFLEGDPDRPIITGRVYHGTNKTPYTLPDEKTKSTIKSKTTPGGKTHNELLMEDKNGKTQVVLSNAYGHKITEDEESQSLTIETRDKHTIKLDDKNKNISIKTTNAHTVAMDDTDTRGEGTISVLTTNGNRIEMDDKNEKMTAQTTKGHTLLFDDKNKKVELVTTDGHSAVLSDGEQKISITSTKGHYMTIDDSGDSITLEDSGGMHRFKLDIGGSKLIIATDSGSIDLEAPSGKISVKGMDVDIEATNELKIKGGMNLTSEAGLQHTTKGTMVSAESSGPHTIKGMPVQIN
jgi:type VI secretion system secreted protein VgrG